MKTTQTQIQTKESPKEPSLYLGTKAKDIPKDLDLHLHTKLNKGDPKRDGSSPLGIYSPSRYKISPQRELNKFYCAKSNFLDCVD